MTHLLLDTSVLVKWFHTVGEGDILEARALRAAHASRELEAHILDLGLYELGNVLVRGLGWSAVEVSDQLDDVFDIVGPPIVFERSWFGDAAQMAEAHTLTFYDACWAAAARALTIPLVSADRQLLAAGLAESPREVVARLRLRVN